MGNEESPPILKDYQDTDQLSNSALRILKRYSLAELHEGEMRKKESLHPV